MSTADPIRFVVHAPGPYLHRSAGLRALYRLASELQQLGYEVLVAQAFNLGSWGALRFAQLGDVASSGDPCPFDVELAEDRCMKGPYRLDLHDDPWRGAVHVYGDAVRVDAPIDARLVRWLLNMRRFPTYQPELEVTWSETYQRLPRLAIDLIEPDLFFPKRVPGEGVLHYIGKRRDYDVADALGTEITSDWPPSRAELGEALRRAELLVSFDTNSQLNHEAVLCGTPVVIPSYCGDRIWEPLFGEKGIAYGWAGLDAARDAIASGAAAQEYRAAQREIADDVARFAELVERTFARSHGSLEGLRLPPFAPAHV